MHSLATLRHMAHCVQRMPEGKRHYRTNSMSLEGLAMTMQCCMKHWAMWPT